MDEGLQVRVILGMVLVVYAVGASVGLLALDLGGGEPEPVAFDETVTVGLTLDSELRLAADDREVDLPRAQVFYSQYPYAVGYYGVERFVVTQRQQAHEQQFGHPAAVYVTVYDDGSVELTDEGYPVSTESTADGTDTETAETAGHAHGQTDDDATWYPAEDAVYVVGSDARTPAGETVVPFADTASAQTFADEYGGDVLVWTDVLDYPFDVDDAEAVRQRTADQHASADDLIDDATALLDREVRVVVGEDAETVQGAIDAAPAGSAILVPAGRYEEHVEIDRAVTVVGEEGAELVGNGTGTVVQVSTDRVGIYGLGISGVGNETPGAAATDDHAHGIGGGHDHGDTDEDEQWDASIEDDYASGDAAIAVDNASGVLVDSVQIHTPASGVMLRESPGAVVQNVTVDGNTDQFEGHMGVVALRSPGVVQHSTFIEGLDGVYTHRADGIVVRNNTMTDNRMGVHLMHTSEALLADNTIANQTSAGIFVMTGPAYNGLVGNDISNSPTGIDVGGTDSYVADNVVWDNDLGMQIDTTGSVFEGNLVVDNDFGVNTRALLPTNQVTENDFVGNGRHVAGSTGPERVWTHDGIGNYWEGAVGTADGEVLDRPYSPTDDVDAVLHRVDGAPALATAPGRDALAGVEGAISGMRDGEIVDTAPLCGPVHREWFQERDREVRPTC